MKKEISKFKYFYIQFHAAVFLLGYLLMQSMLSVISGGASHEASIVYNGFILLSSFFVIILCREDIIVERGRSLLMTLSMVMILYALRILFDIYDGPFVGIVPQRDMWNDFLRTVGGAFLPTWAIICSRKYIDVEKISELSFWFGLATCLFTIYILRTHGISSYEEERVDIGGGLHSLSLAKLGAIEIMAALHVILNKPKKVLCLFGYFGFMLGVFIALASGSRGGVVGVVIAIFVYIIMQNRKRLFFMLLGAIVVALFVINIVPILTWLSDYFPVFSNRMLGTIVDSDTSSRDLLWKKTVNLISDNTFLGYGYRLNADATGYGPHNGLLEVALCLGIPISVIFLCLVYIKGLIYATRMMVDRRFVFINLMSVSAIVSSLSGSSLSNHIFNFSLTLVGIAYYYHFCRNRF